MGKIIERTYPYVLAILFGAVMVLFHVDYSRSEYLNDAVGASLTVCSILIGFVGTLASIIATSKGNNALVDRVFQYGGGRLLKAYTGEMIMEGIVFDIVGVLMYFRDDIGLARVGSGSEVSEALGVPRILFYIWAVLLLLFLLLAFRCFSNMLKLLFS